ncbi:MAG: Outer rane lipoprotein, partial [Candidatus Krumholzibacteriota bacterium]|nr:Outer rane lipoprotein [Candidatus Krumholzibacteriota bacterium]
MGVGRRPPNAPGRREGRRGAWGERAALLHPMNRIIALIGLTMLGLAAWGSARGDSPETLAARFAAHSPDCRNPAGGGPADSWSTACLFERYGESERAYGVLASAPDAAAFGAAEDLRTRLLIELGRYESADSVLALRPHARDRREFCLHQLRRARLNALSGRPERALDLLRRIDRVSCGEFDPYRDYLLVETLLRSDRAGDAVEIGRRRFAAGYPRSLTPFFETEMTDALIAAGRLPDALGFLDTLETRTAQKSALAPVLARETEIRFELGDTLGAIRAARDFIESHGTGKALAVAETAVSRAGPARLDNGAVLDFAGVFVANRRLSRAEAVLAILDERTLATSEAETLRLLRSEISYNGGRYTAAASEAETPFANPALERRAKLLRARAYRGAGEKTRAARAYQAFAGAYPYDPKAPEALYVAWDLYRETKSPKAAGILDRIVEAYPENRYARIATRRIALEHIERRRFTEAIRVLDDALRRWGRDEEAFLYYLAWSYGKVGREEDERRILNELAAVDSFSFYVDPEVPRELALPGGGSGRGGDAAANAEFLDFLECAADRRSAAREGVSREIAAWTPEQVFDEAGAYLSRGLVFLEMGFRDWAESELRIFESWKSLPPRALLDLSGV